jgi:photosystem II stability/assembly factor-like uncharacterized protein
LARFKLSRYAGLIAVVATLSPAQEYYLQRGFTTEDLRGVSAVSSLIAWASGTHGTYLRTLDGGATWKAARVPGAEALDFRDVKAIGADQAYLMSAGPGNRSRIFHTSDGGDSWTQQLVNPDLTGFFDCMAFWDAGHGIALGDPVDGHFVIFTTSDSGAHWARLPSQNMPEAIPGEGAFAASGTCIAVAGDHVWFASGGPVARVFHSADRGASWSVIETPIIHGDASTGIFSIAFRDAMNGVIAGGDYKHPEADGPNLAVTGDGGRTWKLAPVAPQAYISGVAVEPDSAGLLTVGATRVAYISDLQNPGWQETIDLGLNAVSFAADGTAFAVGPKGVIIRFRSLRQTTAP